MRSFVIETVSLVSRREKTARRFRFDESRTLVLGENHVGKSSLIKSIFWTLGADLKAEHTDDTWNDLDVCGCVDFRVHGERLRVVRHGRQFGMWSGDKLLWAGDGVTKGFGPRLAELMGFGLLFTQSRGGQAVVPPPAFLFLPYYVDQDSGWESDVWGSSFSSWFKSGWQEALLAYHVGLKDRRYYELKVEVDKQKTLLDEPQREQKLLEQATLRLREAMEPAAVELDIGSFQGETEELVSLASRLAEEQSDKRNKHFRLANRKAFLEQQLEVVQAAHREVKNDYGFTVRQPHEVTCPTCSATYRNSIVERFKLARDQHWCEEMLVEYRKELRGVGDRLDTATHALRQTSGEYRRIQDLLGQRRKEVTLREVIRGSARSEAVGALQQQVEEARSKVSAIEQKLKEAEAGLKELDAPKRKNEMTGRFNTLLARNCFALHVPDLGPLKSFHTKVKRTGSDKPRTILAYRFAVLQMAWDREGVQHPPLIIDSPNQQDQDDINLPAMIEFIRDQTPQDHQLILGMVSSEGVPFDAEVIELTQKRQLLNADDYDTVGHEVLALVNRAYEEASP